MALSPVTRRGFIKTLGATAAGAFAAPMIHASYKHGVENPVTGDGEHTYEVIHDWLAPPKSIRFGDTHGLCQDSAGRIYVAHTVHPSSDSGDAVLVFEENGRFIRSWGAAFRNGAHGLDLRKEGADEFLYHCDINRRRIVKTTLDGEVIWERGMPTDSGVYENEGQWRPTNVAFEPNGDFFVGDGYGSSYVHRYTSDGEYLATIGSPGAGEGQMRCPHGLWIDDRDSEKGPMLVVADRSNNRLQYFTLDGEHDHFVTENIRQPCHFKLRGDLMLIPDLASVVMLLDKKNRVIARLGDGHPTRLRGAPREQFIPGKFIHPHDAIFLANDRDILVAEWVPIGRITLLRNVS